MKYQDVDKSPISKVDKSHEDRSVPSAVSKEYNDAMQRLIRQKRSSSSAAHHLLKSSD